MNLDHVSAKQISDMEQTVSKLLTAMRKAKLQDEALYSALQTFERELSDNRRRRFDATYPEYSGY